MIRRRSSARRLLPAIVMLWTMVASRFTCRPGRRTRRVAGFAGAERNRCLIRSVRNLDGKWSAPANGVRTDIS